MTDQPLGTGPRLRAIIAELDRWAAAIPVADVDRVRAEVRAARRVFVAGAGKSGLVARAFACRLVHLGLVVHVAGDITTPPIEKGDLLLVTSGSGETAGIAALVATAKAAQAKVALLTMRSDSTMGRAADVVVRVPGAGATAPDGTRITSIQPLGSLFEDLCLLVYDTLVGELMADLDQSEQQLRGRHTNLE